MKNKKKNKKKHFEKVFLKNLEKIILTMTIVELRGVRLGVVCVSAVEKCTKIHFASHVTTTLANAVASGITLHVSTHHGVRGFEGMKDFVENVGTEDCMRRVAEVEWLCVRMCLFVCVCVCVCVCMCVYVCVCV